MVDTVTIAGGETAAKVAVKVPQAGVVAASIATGPVLEAAPFDGVLGLNRRSQGLKDKQGKMVPSNFITAAYKQGVIPRAQVSFFLGSQPSSAGSGAGGVAILGKEDKRFFKGSLTWIPGLKHTSGGWAIKIPQLRVGKGKANFCGASGCVGLIDSGSWGIIGSNALVKPLLNAAEIYMPDIPCGMKTPPLHFDFGAGQVFSLSLSRTANILHKKQKICEPAIKAMDLPITFKKYKGMPVLMLGDTFLREFYTALDNTDPKKPRVGLAYGNSAALQLLARP